MNSTSRNKSFKDFNVSSDESGMKIDLFLQKKLGPNISRRQVRRYLDQGAICIGNRRERFASYKINLGDRVRVYGHFDNNNTGKKQPKNSSARIDTNLVSWECKESRLIAVNKPPFIPSQPTRDPAIKDVAWYLEKQKPSKQSWMVCHRLDKETTGVIVLADGKTAANQMMDRFREKKLRKIYLAVVNGCPKWKYKNFQCYLSPKQRENGKIALVRSGGKLAQTRFRVLASDHQSQLSLIACQPLTGRMHQLRAQLSFLGFPIVGDKVYGSFGANVESTHHLLHAYFLSFSLGNEIQEIWGKPPETFGAFLKNLNVKLDSSFKGKLLKSLASQASSRFDSQS